MLIKLLKTQFRTWFSLATNCVFIILCLYLFIVHVKYGYRL